MTMQLPEGFEEFARLTPEWVLPNHLERQRKRANSSLEMVKSFYDALFPHMDRIIAYLNTLPMDRLSEADKALYRLAATWMEMSHPIDLNWKDTDQRNIFDYERVFLTEPSPAD